MTGKDRFILSPRHITEVPITTYKTARIGEIPKPFAGFFVERRRKRRYPHIIIKIDPDRIREIASFLVFSSFCIPIFKTFHAI